VARVALSFDAWKPGQVAPAVVELPMFVPEAKESAELQATLRGHDQGVSRLAISPDGQTLAALQSQGGEVKLWNLATRTMRASLTSNFVNSYSVAFSPDGKTLAVGYWSNEGKQFRGGIGLWDVDTGKKRDLFQHEPSRGVIRLTFCPDGRLLAAQERWIEQERESKTAIALWDVSRRHVTKTIPEDQCSALCFSPDGRILARGAYILDKDQQLAGTEVKLWDLSQNKESAALANPVHKNPINSLTFSADGHLLAGADFEGNVILWDVAKGAVRTSFQHEEKRRIHSVAFSPDGRTLVVAVGDHPGRDFEPGLIELWDVSAGQRLATFTGHTAEVTSVAFAPDGRLLASGSQDKTIRLWDVRSIKIARQSK
jgi:WD40 repeat protein